MKKSNEVEEMFEKIGFWNMKCVEISQRSQLTQLRSD